MFLQKKTGEVLEEDNRALLKVRAAQHKHEMAMMKYLGELIKDGQSHHCPPVPPSHHPSFPLGASHQSPYLPRMPQTLHNLPRTSYLQDLMDDHFSS